MTHWREIDFDQNEFPGRRMWVLENDKGDELATIEHFADGEPTLKAFYLWIMDQDDPNEMMRCGPQSGDLAAVKASAERRLGERR